MINSQQVDYTRLYQLTKDAAKIKSKNVRYNVENLIESGRINADDTIFVDKAAKVGEWESLFVGSIESLLCDDANVSARRWFSTRGIRG